ncbi:FAD-dependent oxidoreductase [Niveibacterium umoris]
MGEFNARALAQGKRQRIAVIGSGIAGLGAAWLLRDQHDVVVFEAASRLGGHTNTVDVTIDGVTHGVDTGFLVFNRRTYPNLCALFATLEVPVASSDMSFAVSLSEPDIEWAGSSLATVFAQKRNLARPAFWRMLQDIVRFNRETTREAREHLLPAISLGDYLERNRYGSEFRDWYLLPMAAAIWSCPARTMLDYPVATFLRFCHNHGLLQVADRPQWMTVQGGAREYVRRIAAVLPDIRTGCPVAGVRRDAGQVELLTARGVECFDQVIFACHSDQALAILGAAATQHERAILGAIRYQPNRALLHTDAALLPRRKSTWSAWNYAASPGSAANRSVAVSYLINRLQPLPWKTPVVVSLNPFHEPAPERLIAEIDYAHPVFDAAAVAAQAHLPGLQGRNHTWFCGAWTAYGFHEDGLKSAVDVCGMLGAVAPWLAAPVDFEVAA